MRQHPDDLHQEDLDRYHDHDEDGDLEELGTAVYQGSGLSVRALTAEELQQFLDAHHDQHAQLLGSGWATLDSSGRPSGVSGPLRRLALRPPARWRWCRPGRRAAAWAAPAAPPWPPPGVAAARNWPPGPAAWPGGRRWSLPPASPSRSSPPRLACRGPRWPGWRPPRWCTAALVCVHGAHVHGGGLEAQGVAVVPAHLLRGALGCDRVLSDAEVALLATTAQTSLRPAA